MDGDKLADGECSLGRKWDGQGDRTTRTETEGQNVGVAVTHLSR
jgi:hypothetical protein